MKISALKISFMISILLHFSLVIIPPFRSVEGNIDLRKYRTMQLINIEEETNISREVINKAEGEIKPQPENAVEKPEIIEENKPSMDNEVGGDGQFSVYLPFFKVIRLPEFKIRKKPVYPPLAKSRGIEAEVITEVYIDIEGVPRKIIIIKSGGEEFDKSIIEALQQSIFTPAVSKEGKLVPVRVRIPFKFELD